MIAKGQKISDRYQVIKSIGEGGMANVYLAYDTILERNVAVKILRGDLATDEKFVRRFQREALSASSLSHENIVEVYDVGEDNGEYYIVMEYVEGKHLKNLLKKRGKLTVTEVIDIMLQVTSGLTVAHDSYIIHRDIKPQNIMILENGLVKLTDFGIAVAMNSTQLTQTNSVMGSVHYLPPEQASGKGATLQSDIYSLGILMYELLTGKLPYRGDNAVEIALKHLKERIPLVSEELPDIPRSIENIIFKATAKNPKNRYADAREMHDDLATALDSSRKNEERYVYKYSDEIEDAKMVKVKNDKMTKKESEEVVAKQIMEGDMKKQNKLLIALVAIFTGIVVLITTIVVLLPLINKSEKIKVPDVKGLTEEAAVAKLQEVGLEVEEVKTESSNSVDEGLVVRTNPSANTNRKKGTEVIIYISTGSKEIIIEDYTNQNVDRVQGILETKGLKVTIEKQEVDETDEEKDYEASTIIGQSVEPNTALTSGDNITLYVPDIKNLYPDFKSYTVSEILDFCLEYKISVSFVNYATSEPIAITASNSSEYDDLKVADQSRPAGSRIAVTNPKVTIYLDIEVPEEEDNGLD